MPSSFSVRLRASALLLVLIALGGFFALRTDGLFLSPRNLSMLVTELSITATLALGMLLVLLPGHIDLSVGSGAGLMGGVAAVLTYQAGWPAPAALAVALAVGPLLGALMGWMTVRQGIPAFIITLGGMLVFRGLFLAVIQNASVPIKIGGRENLFSLLTTHYLAPGAGFAAAALVWAGLAGAWVGARARRLRHGVPAAPVGRLGLALGLAAAGLGGFVALCNGYRGVPLAALLFGLVLLLTHLAVRHTRWGRHLVAIGGNEEAARLSGIPVARTVILAFAGTGAVAALTGLLQTAYVGTATPNVGQWMELDAVAACVIGGVSLKGGRGSVGGVLFGAMIMAVLLNGMTLLATPPETKMIARGLVLVAAVWLDVRWGRRG